MKNAVISILFIFHQVKCINKYNEIFSPIEDLDNNITLEIGIANTYYIEFKKSKNLTFDINDDDIYQINIHSINCNIEIDSKGEIINQVNLDTYSLRIKKESKSIIINPIIYIIEGRENENYELHRCYLSINSFNENQPEVIIKNKEETIFYFGSENNNSLNISYELKEISDYNFAALFFQFNEKCNFLINIRYNNSELISKNIYNSTSYF